MKTSKWLAVILVLQGMILMGQWTGGRSLTSSAAAGDVPDPASRQMQMIEELKTMNSKMDKLISLLEDGNLQVKVQPSDEGKGTTRGR